MDIRTAASIATIALVGVGAYRVVKGRRQLMEAAAELDRVQGDNRHKVSLLGKIDTTRAARDLPDQNHKSEFDNGRVIEGQAARAA